MPAIDRRIERFERDALHAQSRAPIVITLPAPAPLRPAPARRRPAAPRRRACRSAESSPRRAGPARCPAAGPARSSGARIAIRATAVFSGRCSSDFFLRISPSTCAANCSAWAPRSSAPPAGAEHFFRRRPRRGVNRTRPPPRPDFLGRKRQERREQPEQHRQRRQQRRVRGGGELGAADRRSGALSPARGSRRRSTRRTSRSARARACSCSARDRRSIPEPGARGWSAGRDRRAAVDGADRLGTRRARTSTR